MPLARLRCVKRNFRWPVPTLFASPTDRLPAFVWFRLSLPAFVPRRPTVLGIRIFRSDPRCPCTFLPCRRFAVHWPFMLAGAGLLLARPAHAQQKVGSNLPAPRLHDRHAARRQDRLQRRGHVHRHRPGRTRTTAVQPSRHQGRTARRARNRRLPSPIPKPRSRRRGQGQTGYQPLQGHARRRTCRPAFTTCASSTNGASATRAPSWPAISTKCWKKSRTTMWSRPSASK